MRYILTIIFFAGFLYASAQPESANYQIGENSSLPDVFLIGEYETAYEKLVQGSGDMLLTVCNDSMDEAFSQWNTMLHHMESYAEEQNFDIKGVKIWINVFWNSDGSIRHIVYYPKPNSKNINYQDLTTFFKQFKEAYKLSLNHVGRFSHYGIASFPTFYKIAAQKD